MTVLSARGPLLLGGCAALVLVAGLALWVAAAPVAGAVIAPGEVDGAPVRHPLQHPEGGIVATLAVAEGQALAAGALVLRLDGAALEHEWELVEAQRIEAEARQRRLQAERDGQPMPPPGNAASPAERGADVAQRRLYAARALTFRRQHEQLAQRRVQAEAELAGLHAQSEATAVETALVATERARQQALHEQGLAPASALAGFDREAVRLSATRAAHETRAAELRGLIAEIVLQAETLDAMRREAAEAELAQTGALLLELAARRATLAVRRARLDLRAPVAGRVQGLAVVPGTVLGPGAVAATVIARTEEPAVTLAVRADDIGRIRSGQAATLHLPALALDGPVALEAVVVSISPAAIRDERSGQRLFHARLVLTDAGRRVLGDRALLPGMSVQGVLVTEPRTPLRYILEPVLRQMRGALREP